MSNNIGTRTRVSYAPSSRFALADAGDPATRWRTTLPIVVPVVERVEVVDAVSGGKLVTEFRYRHGHWDGEEREYRGFGCVEQRDTQSFDAYHEEGSGAQPVPRETFSPPTLTRTWYHVGPVRDADGRWRDLDCTAEYWPGDPRLIAGVEGATDRDASRALRGSIVRAELYALDGDDREGLPHTVTEHAYRLREEARGADDRRVWFPHPVAQRTTQWDRGEDPLTQVVYTGAYDAHGNSGRTTSVALPRRERRRRPIGAAVVGSSAVDEPRALATHVRTAYATSPDGSHIHDRVSHVRTYELRTPSGVQESDPDDVAAVVADGLDAAAAIRDRFDLLADADVRLTGHVVNHYDGSAYDGSAPGTLGRFGALTRSETLVVDDELLEAAYGPRRPAYLGGPAPAPAGAPTGFGGQLGYRLETAGAVYAAGYYADTIRRRHDFQTPGAPARGLVLGTQDALGRETRIDPDPHWLLPATVTDPAGLVTTAGYDYRVMQPAVVTDANGIATRYRYHPLGLLSAVVVGDEDTAPDVVYEHDLLAFAREGEPIHVHTINRIDDETDDVVESREFSDGFGQVIQRRAAAEELTFGETGDDVGLAGPGDAAATVSGTRVAGRVVVSGWQRRDNKGRVVEAFEPFYNLGWGFEAEAVSTGGRRVRTFYDARGQIVRVASPDGSERIMIRGMPGDPADRDDVEPSPWALTTYDENDLGETAPAAHRATPTTMIFDALGRAVATIARGSRAPADWALVRTRHDLRGNVVGVTDELGRAALEHVYDLRNRALLVTSLDAGDRISIHDAVGNVVETRDADDRATLRTYDVLNRLERVLGRDEAGDAVTVRERLVYGDGGDPAQPAAERAAARGRNSLGRLRRHDDEAGRVTIEAYDIRGNARARARRCVSDEALASGWVADWDAPGADAALEARSYETATRHDRLRREVEVLGPADEQGQRPRVVPEYERSGALRALSLDGVPYITAMAHNARGQRILTAFGNGMLTRQAYDPDSFRLRRLRSERATPTAADAWSCTAPPLQDLSYQHDPTGNPVTIEERTPGCGVAGTPEGRDRLTRRFEYDALYRLTVATGRQCADIPVPRPFDDVPRCGSAPGVTADNAPDLTEAYTERYRYDPPGNMVELVHRATASWRRAFGMAGAGPDDWAVAPASRLTSIHDGATVRRLEYDRAGQLETENTDRLHRWDHLGRLVAFRRQAGGSASVEARYLYAADGVRVKRWVRRGGTAALDESTVWIDARFEHHKWAKAGGGQNQEVHILDGSARLAVERRGPAHPDDTAPAVLYMLADHLGSCSVTVGADGGWINREEYFPYGESSLGSYRRKRYRFCGKERDEESGLAYHGGRHYAPWLARWVRPDPSDERSAGIGVYAYCRGNPIAAVDPDGRHPLLVAIGGAILINLMLENTANAPGPASPTYPAMTEAEFAAQFTVIYLSGGLAGLLERRIAFYAGASVVGRTAGGMAAGGVGGATGGTGYVLVDDLFKGRISPGDRYGRAALFGLTVGALIGGVVGYNRPPPPVIADSALMRFALRVFRDNPVLQRLAQVWRTTAVPNGATIAQEQAALAARRTGALEALAEFQRTSGVDVQFVENGVVQRASRQPGNYSSLNTHPGRLQIEMQVLDDADTLLEEITHELAYHYTRQAWGQAGGTTSIPMILPGENLGGLHVGQGHRILEHNVIGTGGQPAPLGRQ
jgi:RHS repeat-associated protein